MESTTGGTFIFIIFVILGTFLWGVFVAYRTGRIGLRYAKHPIPQIQQQSIDLEQAFNSSVISIRSDPTTLTSSSTPTTSHLVRRTPPNTPSSTPSSLTMHMTIVSPSASLHLSAQGHVPPPPTPSESFHSVAVVCAAPPILPEDYTYILAKEERTVADNDNAASPREVTMSANGNAAIDGEALQAGAEKTAPLRPIGEMIHAVTNLPKHSSHSSATLSRWDHHRRPSTAPRLASRLQHCLSLESDIPSAPKFSKPSASPKFPCEVLVSVDHESSQSHAQYLPAWMDPCEFIAYGSVTAHSRDSLALDQNHHFLKRLPMLPPTSSHAVECQESFKCMTIQESSAQSGVPSYAAAAIASHTLSFDATDPVVFPYPREHRKPYFLDVGMNGLPYDSDMLARKRPLSVLYDDLKTVRDRMQTGRIPRANTDSRLLRVL